MSRKTLRLACAVEKAQRRRVAFDDPHDRRRLSRLKRDIDAPADRRGDLRVDLFLGALVVSNTSPEIPDHAGRQRDRLLDVGFGGRRRRIGRLRRGLLGECGARQRHHSTGQTKRFA